MTGNHALFLATLLLMSTNVDTTYVHASVEQNLTQDAENLSKTLISSPDQTLPSSIPPLPISSDPTYAQDLNNWIYANLVPSNKDYFSQDFVTHLTDLVSQNWTAINNLGTNAASTLTNYLSNYYADLQSNTSQETNPLNSMTQAEGSVIQSDQSNMTNIGTIATTVNGVDTSYIENIQALGA